MKIAYLVSQFPAINHGYLLRETAELRRLGFEIVTASVKAPDRPPELLSAEEREVAAQVFCIRRVPPAQWIGTHLKTMVRHPAGWLGGLALAVRFSKLRPEKLIRQLFYFAQGVVFGNWAEQQGVCNVHVSFCGNMAVLANRVFPRLHVSMGVYGYGELADPRVLPIADVMQPMTFVRHVSWHGRSGAMLASQRGQWAKQECVALGVDPALFPPRPFRENPDPFTIAYVGRLAREKGQSVLLLALAYLIGQGRRVQLSLIGDGPDRGELERYARELGITEWVRFEGRIDDAALRACYERTDAFVLTSFFEGIPIVLMEAMALEIPCIAPWLTGIPELIADGVDGLLFPPGNHLRAAECIAALMDDPDLRRRLGQNGRARVLREYDINANTAVLAGLFRRWFDGCDTDEGGSRAQI